MLGVNFDQYLRGFEATTVNASNGGTDELSLTDSPVDDLLQLTPMFLELTGSGSTILANGFTHQVVTSGGGNDSVEFLDSAGIDQFYSEPLFSVMQGNNYRNRTDGYSNVRAVASQSGQDEITILGSDGPDQIVLSGSGGNYNGQVISRRFQRFDRATVVYNSGNDDLQVDDIDYELNLIDQSEGDGPLVQMGPVEPDPRIGPIDELDVTFSEFVIGFELDDLALIYDGTQIEMNGTANLSTTDGVAWRVGGLRNLTQRPGQFAIVLNASNSGITNIQGEALANDGIRIWQNVVRGGDANFDAVVDFLDFAILADNFGRTDALWSMGDFDGDGRVGFVDVAILANNFDAPPVSANLPRPLDSNLPLIDSVFEQLGNSEDV